MVPNGVTHIQVPDDQAGVESILRWLSYVPATNKMLPPILPTSDPVDRDVGYTPTKVCAISCVMIRHMRIVIDT